MEDTDIRNYRMVWVWFGAGPNQKETVLGVGLYERQASYIVHKDKVDTFIAATKELHDNPGHNPHNGNKATPVHQIEVGPLTQQGPFWWTTPGLQNNYDASGAPLIMGDYHKTLVWRSDKLKAVLDEERREEDQAESTT